MTPSPNVANTSSGHSYGIPVALILGSCLSLQFGAALATQLFPDLGVWGVSTLRLAFAALILLVAVRPRMHRWTRDQWKAVVLFGISLAGMNAFFYASIALIPLSTAVAIEFLGPLVLAVVLSRRRLDMLWIALAFAGMGMLGLESVRNAANLDLRGVLFALIAAGFWAIYILISSRVGQKVPGNGGLAAALVVGAVILLPVGGSGVLRAFTDPRLFALVVATALLASVIPYTLELTALRRMPRHVFGILLSLEPAVAALVGWVMLSQTVGPLRMVALVLVILASVGITMTGNTAKKVDPRKIEELLDHDDGSHSS